MWPLIVSTFSEISLFISFVVASLSLPFVSMCIFSCHFQYPWMDPKEFLHIIIILFSFSFFFCHIDPYESRIFTFIPLKGCVCKKGKNIVWLERDRSGVRFNGHWIPRNSASLVGPFCRQVHERHCFEVMENYFLFPFMLITCTMPTRTWMKRFSEIKGLRCKSPLIEKNSKKKIEFLWYYQIMCDCHLLVLYLQKLGIV